MHFKKTKNRVAEDAQDRAWDAAVTSLSNVKYRYASVVPNEVIEAIEIAISRAIGTAVKSIVDDIYTDEDFESDIKLDT